MLLYYKNIFMHFGNYGQGDTTNYTLCHFSNMSTILTCNSYARCNVDILIPFQLSKKKNFCNEEKIFVHTITSVTIGNKDDVLMRMSTRAKCVTIINVSPNSCNRQKKVCLIHKISNQSLPILCI
jgi:hypothetical protein